MYFRQRFPLAEILLVKNREVTGTRRTQPSRAHNALCARFGIHTAPLFRLRDFFTREFHASLQYAAENTCGTASRVATFHKDDSPSYFRDL